MSLYRDQLREGSSYPNVLLIGFEEYNSMALVCIIISCVFSLMHLLSHNIRLPAAHVYYPFIVTYRRNASDTV